MRRLVSITLFGALFALAGGTARGPAPAAAQPAVSSPGEDVRVARLRLTRIPVGDMDTIVTPEASAAIEALKDRIIAFVTAALRGAHGNATAAAIQRQLSAQGDAFVDRATYAADNYPNGHGNGLVYEVARPPGHPGLLAVVVRVAIECGDDGMLMLFERSGPGWRPLLIRRSPPYREISGALGSFRYAISPPDAQGRWYVATVRRPPWCTSNWSSLYFELIRTGLTPAAPRVFFSERSGDYSGFGNSVGLRADADQFQLVHDGGFFDPGIMIRRHVETYGVTGDRVVRIAPVALNVRDFVDEWLDAAWPEASAWAAGDPGLAPIHRQLSAPSDGTTFLEQGPIRRCGPDLHQVELHSGRAQPDPETMPRWYFLVSGHGPYRLEGASRSASLRCAGPDLGAAIERANQAERDRWGD